MATVFWEAAPCWHRDGSAGMIGTVRRCTRRSVKHLLRISRRMLTSGKPTKWRALSDAIAELTGVYRVTAFHRRSVIALSARVKTPSRLLLGHHVSVQSGSILHCGGKAWAGYAGFIRLGNGVSIGPYCILYGAGGIALDD